MKYSLCDVNRAIQILVYFLLPRVHSLIFILHSSLTHSSLVPSSFMRFCDSGDGEDITGSF